MDGTDIIVKYDEVEAVSKMIKEVGNDLERAFSVYISIMTKLCDEGFEEGETSENIRNFVDSISTLKGDISAITTAAANDCTAYMDDLDDADKFTY